MAQPSAVNVHYTCMLISWNSMHDANSDTDTDILATILACVGRKTVAVLHGESVSASVSVSSGVTRLQWARVHCTPCTPCCYATVRVGAVECQLKSFRAQLSCIVSYRIVS